MPTAHGKAFGYGGSCPKLLQQEGLAILPQGRWWSIFPERRLDEFDPAIWPTVEPQRTRSKLDC